MKVQSFVVQSGLLMVWDKGGPVPVLVLLKMGKIPDWTGLSSTNRNAVIPADSGHS